MVRQAHHERIMEMPRFAGNHTSTRANRATHATVVPAKAGIQEIPREKNGPATGGSGFRLSPERRFYDVIVLAHYERVG